MSIGRTGRLLGILQLLRQHTWLSAQDLAGRLGVSLRTIYRDVADIQSYGISIRSTIGRDGGYQLDDESPFPRALLANEDAMAMFLMGGGMDKTSVAQTPRFEEVLTHAGPEAARALQIASQRIYFDTSEWYWRDNSNESLPVLREAIFQGNVLRITQIPRNGGATEHLEVYPLGLVWKGGEWYLVASKPSGTRFRTRLSRLSDIELSGRTFSYPKDFDLQAWWRDELEAFGKGDLPVKLRVMPGAQEDFRRLSTKSSTQVEADGDDLIFTFFVDHWQWMIPLVLSHSPDVVAMEPSEVRDAVAKSLRRALSRHEDQESRQSEDFAVITESDPRRRATRGLGGSRGND